MSKYRITQVVSKNGETKRQNPVTTGMVTKVRHLVTVEEI